MAENEKFMSAIREDIERGEERAMIQSEEEEEIRRINAGEESMKHNRP
jgi:hypothetical protein